MNEATQRAVEAYKKLVQMDKEASRAEAHMRACLADPEIDMEQYREAVEEIENE